MPTQPVRFDNVYVSPRVRVALHSVLDTQYAKKFWDLINKLRTGLFNTPGMRVERLRTAKGKVYSARLNIDMRVIFSMYTDSDTSQRSLVVWDANHHDDAYNRIERTVVPVIFQPSNNFLEPEQIWSDTDSNLAQLEEEVPDRKNITDGLLLFRVPYYVLAEPTRYQSFEKNIDRYLRLSEEQEELLRKTDRAYLVKGAAGTGKTSLALFYALNLFEQHPQDNIYFFTYQDELACVCRCYKNNLVEEDNAEEATGEFHVFSYLEFCRHYLKQQLDQKQITWKWIGKDTSIQHLKDIIGTRSRWMRTVRPENLYSYIYSILKGRFVPGTDKLPQSSEDFQRIFKGYGSHPHNLEDLLEIFGHYEERLTRLKQRDEADLIKYCYQTLKDRALLSEKQKATWILIDEIQDFTELEWKSILLFWENQCIRSNATASYPFLCGDRNQNISRSGFRWQEVDSYVETILRGIHRPNAVEKVQLHRNFRNTQQIFQLASFVRASAPEVAADLGLPPELVGKKPQIVIGEYADFLAFLKLLNAPYDVDLPAPLVILFEDTDALEVTREAISDDDELFFMPVNLSKGLEFEDLIIYRLFSSLGEFEQEELRGEEASRIFDLWYMAITRARQNLLIFLTPRDLEKLKVFFGDRFSELLGLVELHSAENANTQLLRFYHQRERYIPNYSLIFLERTKANDVWQQFRKEIERGEAGGPKAKSLKEKAFKLWRRCRDLASLGKAHAEIGEFAEAIPYLTQVSMYPEVAACYEKLQKFEQAAQNYEEAGHTRDAARCYEKANKFHHAARLYESLEQWLQAATNYYLGNDNLKAAQCFENERMWQSAADLYRTKSQWHKAAQLYQKANAFEQAGDMYLKLKDKLDAARCYQSAELNDKAAALFESLMRWSEAAECYERAGVYDKAGLLYSKAGKLKDAARCKEQSGDLVSAAAAYERMRNWERAAYAYIQLKQFAKAAECFENDQNWEQAITEWTKAGVRGRIGRCLENLGHNKEAAEIYQETQQWLEAGHCFEKAEQFAEAADNYLKAQNYAAAASMLARMGRRFDAAKLYLIAGQPGVAVEVCSNKNARSEKDFTHDLILWVEQSKKWDAAGALYENLGMLPRAVEKYRQAMMLAKAAECAEKGGMYDIGAELHMQEGRLDKAAYCFQQSQQLQKAAECYEILKKWDEACALYEVLGDQEGIRRCKTAANWL